MISLQVAQDSHEREGGVEVEEVVGLVGVVIGIASLAFAFKAQHEKRQFEQLLKSTLVGLAGSIVMIRNNPALAHKNIDYILKRVDVLGANPDLNRIINRLAWAQGDSAATHRLLEVLLNDVLSLQEGLFGTRDAKAPNSAGVQDFSRHIEGEENTADQG